MEDAEVSMAKSKMGLMSGRSLAGGQGAPDTPGQEGRASGPDGVGVHPNQGEPLGFLGSCSLPCTDVLP